MASIHSIVYRPPGTAYKKVHGPYVRLPLQQARLVAGHGIEGDVKGGNPDRNLNVMSLEWLNDVATQGYLTKPGQMGEQLIIEGLAVETLAPGARLQLGKEALIEISKLRTGCELFESAQQGKTREGLALGAMARVVTGGMIAVGDEVRLV